MLQPSPTYWLPEEVVLQELDLSVLPTASLAVVRGRHYHVSGLARIIMSYLKTTSATAAGLTGSLQEADPSLTYEQVQRVLSRLLNVGLLESDQAINPPASTPPSRRRSYFALRVPIISRRALSPIAKALHPLFDRRCVGIGLPLLLLVQLLFWSTHVQLIHSVHHWPRGWQMWLVMFGSYCGLFAHELGHASAASSRGAQHGPIGFAIYLIFPAFYTDVTTAWRLPRAERVVVDLGGIYMSSICAAFVLGLFVSTHNPAFLLLTAAYDITIVLNLNPFIRMDGYWVLSDLLGVPSLMMANRQLCKWLLLRARGRLLPPPSVLTLSNRLRYVYLGYYVAFILFVSWATVMFYLFYLPHAIRAYPQLIRSIIVTASDSGISLRFLEAVGKFVAAAIPLVGCLLYLLPMCWRAVRAVAAYDSQSPASHR
jgi:putative peptide zinc metalloprotease protein